MENFYLYTCCCLSYIEDDDRERVAPDLRGLLDSPGVSRSTPRSRLTPCMGRPRTYGARKKQASAAATVIFGTNTRKNPPTLPTSPTRNALADITSAFNNVTLGGVEGTVTDTLASGGDDDDESSEDTSDSESEEDSDNSQNGALLQQQLRDSILESQPGHLLPLITSYSIDTGRILTSHSWADLLPEKCTVIKIAEASYAEVYRVTIPSGDTSIIKVMRIESPDDPAASKSGTTIRVENIVSEVRIMNALTELPGFVRFKDAHIIRGRSVQPFIDAYEQREALRKGRRSQFPNPKAYTEKSEFLAIELGDAGCVLEDFVVKSIDQVWDIFLGTVLALAKGEMANEFEHRDLHENNICVSVSTQPLLRLSSSDSMLKLGFAGIKVTLIDYGLSRATLQNGDKIFFDLENEPVVFQGSEGHPQFNAYRRMRTNLMTSERISKTKAWHADPKSRNPKKSWAEYIPYTNVIWIGYMLGYLKKMFKKADGAGSKPLKAFNEETKELSNRLDSRTKIENGAFLTATDVLYYFLEKGWISEEQAEEYGADMSTILEP